MVVQGPPGAPAEFIARLTARLPRYDSFPAILFGRLAVDSRHNNQGLGKLLLLDALASCLAISHDIGAMAVVVEAKDDASSAFYRPHGLLTSADHEDRLYLPMATVVKPGMSLTSIITGQTVPTITAMRRIGRG